MGAERDPAAISARPVSAPNHQRRFASLSLRQRLLLCLLPLMLLITAVELWSTQREALASANSAYDRSIRGALQAIESNISTVSGGLAVELPYRLFELLELTASGHVYFRVSSLDGLVEVGDLGLPLSATGELRAHQPVFSDAVYLGERVRMGALLTHVRLQGPQGPEVPVLIQVAEQARSREQFAAQFVRTSLLRAAVVLLALMGAVVAVVSWVLQPLGRLEAEVHQRQASDVSPLDTHDLPRDVRPLVHAVNTQMARRQALADRQREFLDDASHQLRTPLTTLRTQVDYAVRSLRRAASIKGGADAGDADDVLATLLAMQAQVAVATRSTNQLLSLARSDAAELQPEAFDLTELLREVVLSLLPRARARGLDLGIEAPDTLPAWGDLTLWREALSNLLDNALLYAREGSAVTACAHTADGTGRPGWCLTVVNDAEPWPAELKRKLQAATTEARSGDLGPEGRFVRGQGAPQGGAGLGLAIARRMAERHGGTCSVHQSAQGRVEVRLQWMSPLA